MATHQEQEHSHLKGKRELHVASKKAKTSDWPGVFVQMQMQIPTDEGTQGAECLVFRQK